MKSKTPRSITRKLIERERPPANLALVFSQPSGDFVRVRLSAGALTLGRHHACDVVLEDESVSREHARISGSPRASVLDLSSTNGTRLMGDLLAPQETRPLQSGQVLEFGTVVCFVQPAVEGDELRGVVHGTRLGTPAARSSDAAPPVRNQVEPGAGTVVIDPAMKKLYGLLPVITPSKLSIVILGETGSGKDVYAEALHAASPRASKPFLRLNCAALPEALLEAELFGYERGAFTGAVRAKEGLFESADGGSVFLDEIGEMPLLTQAKLLRVLESGDVTRLGSVKSRRVDVRFISATHRDLGTLVDRGHFREDLFYRLNGVTVTLPPLRKRPTEILPLARVFLRLSGHRATSLSPEAERLLLAHRWPGNIRELRNVVERAALLCGSPCIEAEHLHFAVRGQSGGLRAASRFVGHGNPGLEDADANAFPAAPGDLERAEILAALEACAQNQSRAAKLLGISRSKLRARLDQYGVVRPRKPLPRT